MMHLKMPAAILAAFLLCACSYSPQNENGIQSDKTTHEISSAIANSANTNSQNSATKDSSIALNASINWGSASDSLKQFDDDDGRINRYQDYTMTVRAEMNGIISKEITLSFDTVGSDYLTGFQRKTIVAEHPPLPENQAKMILTVTDEDIPYQYLLFDGGKLYTIQSGKTYYLGNDAYLYQMQLITFLFTASTQLTPEQTEVPELPSLDPWGNDSSFLKIQNDTPHKTDFTPERYNVVVVETDYGNLYPPIMIRDEAAKAQILDYINNAVQQQDELQSNVSGGGGPIIRVYNDAQCYNYLPRVEQLLDYQNGQIYTLPYGMWEYIQSAVAYELVCLFEEK